MHKLTPQEISSAVDKIRRRYDEYTYKYLKPRTIRNAFEDRYIARSSPPATSPAS